MEDKIVREIKELLETFDGEIFDLCYKLISENENLPEVFQYACENFTALPKEKKVKIDTYFSPVEINELESVLGDIVNGLIKSTIKKCNFGLVTKEDFYSALWEGYSTNFSTVKEKAFAFYYTLIDRRIPYQYLGKPLSIDDDKFKELIETNRLIIKKIEYIKNSAYQQKTENASLVLNCLNETLDFESKVVVLARAIDILCVKRTPVNVGVEDLIRQIDEKIAELEKEED
jgi:hypothetical protein